MFERALASTTLAIVTDIAAIVRSLTVEQKASLTAGTDFWNVAGIASCGIPAMRVTDGPNGARGSALLGGGLVSSACVPCGSALGATWDPALIEDIGALVGDEARTKGCRFLLGPTINLHRSPIAGRNFECYSEDPLLSGRIAAAFVRGVQSRGVAATVKHFVGNEAEFERNSISSDIDERTLRELYLRPFEIAVGEGGVLAVMTAYNRLNGKFCTEQRSLLTDMLRDQWGFDGIVMTDWFGVAGTVASSDAGLDLEMPGPARAFGTALAEAVRDGRVPEATLDAMVMRWLSVIDRLDAWNDPPPIETSIDRPEHRALARRAATDSIVLLHNNGILPIDDNGTSTIALIGPMASVAHVMGGGSAQLTPHYRMTPAEVLGDRLGHRLTMAHGCTIDRSARAAEGRQLRTATGEFGVTVDFFANQHWQGEAAYTTVRPSTRLLFFDDPVPGINGNEFSFRATTTFTANADGVHHLALTQLGRARVLVDGHVVIDGITDPPPAGDEFFGLAGREMRAPVPMQRGQSVELTIESSTIGAAFFYGVKLGVVAPATGHDIDDAVAAAVAADIAVVMVGTSDEWESEGHDRSEMDLPGDQDELVRRIAAANPNTVVVVNAGAPVTMPWADEVAAVLYVWLGGQEMAGAIDAVLFGDAEPAGRLPVTMPLELEHNPTFGTFPGENDHLRYGEGLLMGYRHYDTRHLPTRFPFGHGGSYTSFTWSDATLSSETFAIGDRLRITLPVTNTGTRRGAEVVQCYVQPARGPLYRPARELVGWAKLWLEPGETATATIELDARSFAHWDPTSNERAFLRERSRSAPHAVAPASPRDTPGWWIDAGTYTIELARSVVDVQRRLTIDVVGGRIAESC